MSMQQEIITTLGVRPEINPSQEIADRTDYLTNFLGATGLNGFVLGISGGQDSLLAGMLAQRAVNQLRVNGRDVKFHAVLLPYGTQADRSDAELACEVIKPDVIHDLNIKASTDAMAETFRQGIGREISDFHKGNIKARMRMVAQYAIAGEYGLLVVGTDHAAEAVTGFFTKFGDGGADILPLSGLTKRQERELLKTLEAPERLYLKQPTADLLDNTPGNPDEAELGLSYDTLDDYLEGKQVAPEVAANIEARYIATEHKRSLPAAYTDNEI